MLDLRQLCNFTYSALVEFEDQAGRAKIDRALTYVPPEQRRPGRVAAQVSTGTDQLMAVMASLAPRPEPTQAPPPPAVERAPEEPE